MVRAILLQFITLFVFISFQTFDFFHPLSWLSATVGLLITPASWFYDLIAIFVVIGIGILYAQQLKLSRWIPKNNLTVFMKLFEPTVMMSMLAHFVAGGVLMRSYLGLLGGQFNSLSTVCNGGLYLKKQD
jgi:hypothetical protein